MTPTPWEGAEHAPHDWQRAALAAVGSALRAGERPVVEACTGAGKSLLIAEMAHLTPGRVVISTPTQDLVEQLHRTISRRTGGAGRWYGRAHDPEHRVVVTCMPSLPTLPGEPPALLIVDECHRSEAPEYRATVEAIAPRWIVGVTATPYLSDPTAGGLGLFSTCAYSYQIEHAIRDRVLVPYRVVTPPAAGEDVDAWVSAQARAAEGPGIVSAATIADAEGYAAYLSAEGVPASAIHGGMHAAVRADILGRLYAGKLRAVVHPRLLVEGVDLPWLRWLALRRRRGRVGLTQEVGRVIRVDRMDPAKQEAVIYDPHLQMIETGLAHPAALGDDRPRTRSDVRAIVLRLMADGEVWSADRLIEAARDSRVPQVLERLEAEGQVCQVVGGWLLDPWDVPDVPAAIRSMGRTRALPALAEWVRAWAEALGVAVEPHRQDDMPPSPTDIAEVGRWAHVARVVPQPERDQIKLLARREVLSALHRDVARDLAAILCYVAEETRAERRARRYPRWRWARAPEVPL